MCTMVRTADGSHFNFDMMFFGQLTYAISWLRFGEPARADAAFELAFAHQLGPWNVWREHGSAKPEGVGGGAVNFLTGSGAFLQAFLFGYLGLSVTAPNAVAAAGLELNPVLPSHATNVTVAGVTFDACSCDVFYDNMFMTVRLSNITTATTMSCKLLLRLGNGSSWAITAESLQLPRGRATIERATTDTRSKSDDVASTWTTPPPPPCSCTPVSLCKPLTTPHSSRQLFAFGFPAADVSNRTAWRSWPWASISSVGLVHDPPADFICIAHAHNVQVIQNVGAPRHYDGAVPFLRNQSARAAWVNKSFQTARRYGLDGLSIDIEANVMSTRSELTTLVAQTAAVFRADNPHALLAFSTTMYPFANYSKASPAVMDYAGIAKSVDLFCIMAYDPFGAHGGGRVDELQKGLAEYIRLGVPRSKLVPCIGTFGFDFSCMPTKTGAPPEHAGDCTVVLDASTGRPVHAVRRPDSFAIASWPGPTTASIINNATALSLGWDEECKLPFLVYEQSSTWHQHVVPGLWFEDALSISIKRQMSESMQLGGMGIFLADFLSGDTPRVVGVWNALTGQPLSSDGLRASIKTDDATADLAPPSLHQRLRGTFIATGEGNGYEAASWTPVRWEQEVASMHAIGLDTITTISSIREDFSLPGHPRWSVYPSDLPGVKMIGPEDAIEGLLSASDRWNISVHLGLELNAYGFSGPHSNMTRSFFDTMGKKNAAIAMELHNKYGHHDSLVGMYDPHELNDVEWTAWSPPDRFKNFLQSYLKPTYAKIHELGYSGMNAPYFCGSFNPAAVAPHGSKIASQWGPANITSFYSSLLSELPGLDILAVQDCRGVFSRLKPGDARWNTTAPELPYYRAFQQVVAKAGKQLWSTSEIFWYPDGLKGTTQPAPMQRIAKQLSGEGEVVSKLTSFAWQNMSPYRNNESAQLYKDYQRWLEGAAPAPRQKSDDDGPLTLTTSNR